LIERNIGLIGFMGTGKTSVGRALAISLDRQFFDTDTLIESTAGRTIPQIFNEEGEKSVIMNLQSLALAEALCSRSRMSKLFGIAVLLYC
jgi:shikimate kinase